MDALHEQYRRAGDRIVLLVSFVFAGARLTHREHYYPECAPTPGRTDEVAIEVSTITTWTPL